MHIDLTHRHTWIILVTIALSISACGGAEGSSSEDEPSAPPQADMPEEDMKRDMTEPDMAAVSDQGVPEDQGMQDMPAERCALNEYVSSTFCVPCPPGTTREAGDPSDGPDTMCLATRCAEDERVLDNTCVPCDAGATNEAGDGADGPDTMCEAVLCGQDERVQDNACVACGPDKINAAGDDATELDTTCEPALCEVNEYVLARACEPCPRGQGNPAGDDRRLGDTTCGEPLVKLSLGFNHSCFVDEAGQMSCWGANGLYQANASNAAAIIGTPTLVNGISQRVLDMGAGQFFTCALLEIDGLKCWGINDEGQLADGTTTNRVQPVSVTGFMGTVAHISLGYRQGCMVLDTGQLKCWGNNENGQLGLGTIAEDFYSTPQDVDSQRSSAVKSASLGQDHACLLTQSGQVECWGSGTEGQLPLGMGVVNRKTSPASTAGFLPGGFISVGTGFRFTCALRDTGDVYCWGRNVDGQLGDNGVSGTASDSATVVNGINGAAIALAVGARHACALLDTGEVRCWGDNGVGQIGSGSGAPNHKVPVTVTNLDMEIDAIAAGDGHTCAWSRTGVLKCWGVNGKRQLGFATEGNSSPTPMPVTLP